jgi:hypothetical protein
VARQGNAGISGDTVQQVLARLDAVLSSRPDRLLLKVGTNNTPTEQGIIDGKTAYVQILDRALTAGTAVACVSIPPRTATQDVKDRGIAWNAWVKAEAESRGLPFINTFPLFADGTGGWADLTNTSDGIHLTEKGARTEGAYVAGQLAAYYPAHSAASPARTGDTANLLTSPFFADANADGLPDGWTVPNTPNIYSALTTDPSVTGNVLRVEKMGAEGVNLFIDPTGWKVGDKLAFGVRIYAPTAGSYTVYLGAFNASNGLMGVTYGVQTWAGSGTTWGTVGGQFTVPAGTAYVRFVLLQYASGAANGAIYLAQPAVRVVQSTVANAAAPATVLYRLGVTGVTHRWTPDGQSEAAGAAVASLTDRVGTMNLAAMASGTRTMQSDALGKYVEGSGVDNSGFQGAAAVPAGPKTISLVVQTVTGTLASYAAQVGGFNINRSGSGWNVFQSGSSNTIGAGPATGTWEHILFTWDGTTGKLYFNRETAEAATLTAEGIMSNTLLIKGAGQVKLREAVTFDHALSAAEITAHRNALKAKWTDLP